MSRKKERSPEGLHHRIYPYMDHVVQYATEREGAEPWIVRDRQAALSNERKGQGKALFRTWMPTDWECVNLEPVTDTQEEQ